MLLMVSTASERCRKCGAENDNPRYHNSSYGVHGCSYNDIAHLDAEHLHRYCKCGYDWTCPLAQLAEDRHE